ncbi:unnamed protein product [Clavelina lepadiformis]|uniref:Carbohydrate sulfotransferase n=1 Tax=Clavelina lepadiformis TaxID=159417 RepID=A0ABP0FAI2_CLALP
MKMRFRKSLFLLFGACAVMFGSVSVFEKYKNANKTWAVTKALHGLPYSMRPSVKRPVAWSESSPQAGHHEEQVVSTNTTLTAGGTPENVVILEEHDSRVGVLVPLDEAPTIHVQAAVQDETTKENDYVLENLEKDTYENSSFMKRMSQRMADRKAIMFEACQALGLNRGEVGKIRLLLSDKYKLAYCPVPKTGCSNMKRIVLELNGYNTTKLENLQVHDVSHQIHYEDYGIPETMEKMSYTSVILVRHPYERLVSSYNNKIRFPYNDDFHEFAEEMKALYRNFSRFSDTKSSPSFEEFVQYISDGRNNGDHTTGGERHWSKYNSICFPCLVDYDVIAHLETIQEDSEYLLKLIGAPSALKFSSGYAKSGKSETKNGKYIENYFNQLTQTQKDKLYNAYESDFKLFGYFAGKETITNIL